MPETTLENRFMHVPELNRMGTRITVHGASVSLVLAELAAGILRVGVKPQRLSYLPLYLFIIPLSLCLKYGASMAEPTKSGVKPEVTGVTVDVPSDYVTPITEALPINEILVDGIANAALVGGTVRFAMFVERPDPTKGGIPTRPIVCRLAMTPMVATLIRDTLTNMLESIEALETSTKTPTATE